MSNTMHNYMLFITFINITQKEIHLQILDDILKSTEKQEYKIHDKILKLLFSRTFKKQSL